MGSRPEAGSRRLIWASLALVALVWLHDLDHVRQLREVEPAVGGLGLLGVAASLGTLALAIVGSRWAPAAAVLVGFATAAGFVLVHLVPDWGPLSDGYADAGVDAISWTMAVLPVIGALNLGIAGLAARRARAGQPARA